MYCFEIKCLNVFCFKIFCSISQLWKVFSIFSECIRTSNKALLTCKLELHVIFEIKSSNFMVFQALIATPSSVYTENHKMQLYHPDLLGRSPSITDT